MQATAFFARICQPGLMDYADVVAGRVALQDCFDAALMLDWREHCAVLARAQARNT